MISIILILLITQIIVESLPISSSSHVALVEFITKKLWGHAPALPDFIDNSIHITALVAILIVFYKDWGTPVRELFKSWWLWICGKKQMSYAQKKLNAIFLKIVGLVFVADLITSVFYLFIKVLFKDFFCGLDTVWMMPGLVVTALMLLSLKGKEGNRAWIPDQVRDDKHGETKINSHEKNNNRSLALKKGIILGTVQGLALLPGISRFASTYVAGCWLNLRPAKAFQVSFLLHFPLICAEVFLLGLPKLIKHSEIKQGLSSSSLVVILLATIIAILLLDLCYKLAVKNKLWWFGIYMLLPTALLLYFTK